jgi:hypothetical protein
LNITRFGSIYFGPGHFSNVTKLNKNIYITRVIEGEWKEALKFGKKIQNSVNIFILNQSFFPVIL